MASAAARQDEKLNAEARDQTAEDYAGRAIALLHNARAARFFQRPTVLDHLRRCPDFAPLRGRDDFKQLLAEAEKQAPAQ